MTHNNAQSIVEGFFRSAELHPDKIAIIWKDESISYSKVSLNVLKIASFLKEKGVNIGDRVAFYGEKSPLFVYMYLATHLVKAVAVPLDVKLPEDRFNELLHQTEPRILFHPKKTDFDFPQFSFDDDILAKPEFEVDDFPQGNGLADILFTTGTTGNAKGVQLTHKNILAGALNSNDFIGNDSSDMEIIPLPLHHAFGLRRLRTNLFLGATVFLVDGFMFPKMFFEAIEEYGANGLCMVPAGFSVIKKLMKDRYIQHFEKLKYIEFGSSPMSIEEKRELVQSLPDTRICMHYGLTEVAANIFNEFHSAGDKIHALGRPSPNSVVNILNESGKEVESGETGEISVKGDMQTPGYWRNSELTDKAFVDGWFKTGDLGYRDEEGYIYLSGRKDDVINIGGKKVLPTDVEAVLTQHSLVKDSACIAITDDAITGQRIKAFVVLEGNKKPEPKELIQFLRGKLEPFKIPQDFQFVEKIPYTSSGKKQREKLR